MNSFETRYNKLNIDQKRAVDTLEGPVLVVAGPGAGKTELLSIRIANILKNTDTLPSSILCLTFTDAAAKNMRDRLFGLIGADAYKVAIHTFHSFGTEIIGRNSEFFWDYATLMPADDVVIYQLLQELIEKLPDRDPLRAYHPTQGYSLIGDVRGHISNLKKGGVSPAEFKAIIESNYSFLKEAEPVMATFFAGGIKKRLIDKLPELVAGLATIPCEPMPAKVAFPSFKEKMLRELGDLLSIEKTNLLTKWKDSYMSKKYDNSPGLKDLMLIKKHRSMALVYEQYQQALFEKGYFDFDDMLLKVVQSMEEFPELRYNLAEQYLYIMLDEFQDTNGVQMRLVRDIAENAPGGQPNILAVGDDDQAIYKFQGANLANILGFHEMFGETAVITLVDNYRSTQGILDTATSVIEQSTERLVDRLPEISKKLKSHSTAEEQIEYHVFADELEEVLWVTEAIAEVQAKAPDDSIAVIVRNHSHLNLLLQSLQAKGIAFSYERKNNILKEPMIVELATIVSFATKLLKTGTPYDESQLPEIMGMPFWGISANSVWDTALIARREQKSWIEAMSISGDPKVQELVAFLKALAQKALDSRLEDVLFTCIGSSSITIDGVEYTSPYKNYYFSEQKDHTYLSFLATLKVFMDAISNHKKSESLYAADLLDFVSLHTTFNLPLSNTTPLQKSTATLTLLTAHKAKGLEYDHVFVIRANKEDWVSSSNHAKLALPHNLPLEAEKDNMDDKCRLLFVAMTRAKKRLAVTRFENTLSGKSQHQIPFIEEFIPQTHEREDALKEKILEDTILKKLPPDILSYSERLKEMLSNYSLSATHLQTFVNVINEGPDVFLEKYILRFPSPKAAVVSYGTAMHTALQRTTVAYKMNGMLPDITTIQGYFVTALQKERLAKKDFDRMVERGKEALEGYLAAKKESIDPEDKVEVRFAGEEVYVGGAHITGNIDVMHVDETSKEIVVTDYKTGKAYTQWKGKNVHDHLKLFKYEMQLYFYKLLIESSRSYGGKYTVSRGQLDFVEATDDKYYVLPVYFEREKEDRLKKLIQVVYSKITNLDFPDISVYPQTMQGIQSFIDDLVEERI